MDVWTERVDDCACAIIAIPAPAACRKLLRFTLAIFHELHVKVVGVAEDDHALALRQRHWRAANGDHRKSHAFHRRSKSVDISHQNAQHSLTRLRKRRGGDIACLRFRESDSVPFQSKQSTVELRRL